MYFSLWSTGGLNWCRLTSGCDQLAQQSWHTIAIYQKRSTPDPTPANATATASTATTTTTTTVASTTAKPTPDDYMIFQGPGQDYCDAGHIFSIHSDGYDDCKSRCSAESSCTYFSLWSTGGLNWCRLTSGCAQLAQQLWHTITIYQKRSTPDPTPTTATATASTATTNTTTTVASTTANPTPDDYMIFQGPGQEFCDAGHIFSSLSDGYDDCKSRCSAESSCMYLSLWSTG